MDEKMLFVKEPLVRCYPHHAHMFSTICNNSYDIMFVLQNYIQLIYNPKIDRIDYNYALEILDFYKNYPLVEKHCYDKKMVENKWGNYEEFLFDIIDSEFYAVLLIDKFYIKSYSREYNIYHESHDIMIYGYDKKKRIFFIADCFNAGKYEFSTASFEEIRNAILSEDEYDWLEGIHVWKKREQMYLSTSYNIKEIKELFIDFLNSSNRKNLTMIERNLDEDDKYIYGICSYDAACNYLKSRLLKQSVDMRIIYVLSEHSDIISFICKELCRYSFLKNYEFIDEKLSYIRKELKKVLYLFAKFNINKDNKNIASCISRLNCVKEEYMKVIQMIIDNLCENNFDDKLNYKEQMFSCKYKIDEDTQGNWKGIYGDSGYDIVADERKLPNDMAVNDYQIKNGIYIDILSKGGDCRALQKASGSERSVAYLLNQCFSIKLNLQSLKRVSLYFVDYDELDRKIEIDIYDLKQKKRICNMFVEEFYKGKYLSFELIGKIVIVISKVQGPDAVVSGIFFD